MSQRIRGIVAALVIGLMAGAWPVLAFKDSSDRLRERAIRLADQHGKESKLDFLRRTNPDVQFADAPPPRIGDEQVFNVHNFDTEKPDPTPAVLRHIGRHCYLFVEKGQTLDAATLNYIATGFDEKIYPLNREHFGSEWTPGIDGDPRIVLLLLGNITQGTDGFFFPDDEYPREKAPASNEREMLYLKIKTDPKEWDEFLFGLVSHEFQHLIHWHNDPREYAWFDEACAETACYLFGRVTYFVEDHFAQPYRNLVDWEDTTDSSHYGEVFLFLNFLLQEAAEDDHDRKALLRRLVASPRHGIQGIVSVFEQQKLPLSFQEIFRKYAVALHYNDPARPTNRPFGFDNKLNALLKPYEIDKITPKQTFRLPFSVAETMKLWASKGFHFDLAGVKGPLYLNFRGKTHHFKQSGNAFKIAALFYDSKNRLPPALEWIPVKRNLAAGRLQTPFKRFDSLLVVVCNTGSARMDNGKPPVEPLPFSLSLAHTPNGVEALPRRPDATAASGEGFRELFKEYAAYGSDTDPDLRQQTEEELLSLLQEASPDERSQLVQLVKTSYFSAAAPQKVSLYPLVRKATEISRFQRLQNPVSR